VAERIPGRSPRWKRHQIIAAYCCGILGLVYVTIQGVSEPLWGVRLDFGWVTASLAYIAATVIFNIRLPGIVRAVARWAGKDPDLDDEAGYDDA